MGGIISLVEDVVTPETREINGDDGNGESDGDDGRRAEVRNENEEDEDDDVEDPVFFFCRTRRRIISVLSNNCATISGVIPLSSYAWLTHSFTSDWLAPALASFLLCSSSSTIFFPPMAHPRYSLSPRINLATDWLLPSLTDLGIMLNSRGIAGNSTSSTLEKKKIIKKPVKKQEGETIHRGQGGYSLKGLKGEGGVIRVLLDKELQQQQDSLR